MTLLGGKLAERPLIKIRKSWKAVRAVAEIRMKWSGNGAASVEIRFSNVYTRLLFNSIQKPQCGKIKVDEIERCEKLEQSIGGKENVESHCNTLV